VLLLLVAAVLLLKRRLHQSWQRPTGLLEVMERRALTAGTQLVVTRYAGRRLLLSVGPAGTQLLRDDADVETSK
jgi:flagellar biogenesis protein FliO